MRHLLDQLRHIFDQMKNDDRPMSIVMVEKIRNEKSVAATYSRLECRRFLAGGPKYTRANDERKKNRR